MLATAPLPPRLSLYLDLIRWIRPAGWLLLLWPTLSALWIAGDGWPGWHLVFVFVAGTVLMRSAVSHSSRDIGPPRHTRTASGGSPSVAKAALATTPTPRVRR